MGDVDYAAIATGAIFVWIIIRYQLIDQNLTQWVLTMMLLGVPLTVYYYLMRSALIALKVMRTV
jgi:hypothetical protein